MKKAKILLGMIASLVLIVGITSCSRDNDNGIDNNASIIGTWGCVHGTETYQWNGEQPDVCNNCFVGQILNFKDDGILSSSRILYAASNSSHDSYRYILLKNDNIWMRDGSILYTNGRIRWNIQQLTNDKLILHTKAWGVMHKKETSYDLYSEEPNNWQLLTEITLELKRQS